MVAFVAITDFEISHEYALLPKLPVASSLPSLENDTQDTESACWRGEPMGWPFSRFHNCAVWSSDTLARIQPSGEIAMPVTVFVCLVKTAVCCQVVVFHVLIEQSDDPDMRI
jgi:hypothetical protein